jgi:erythromycin esterase
MLIRSIAAVSLLFATAQSDTQFLAWAQKSMQSITSFRALDKGIRRARVIGIGESVHEQGNFIAFRRELLQDMVRRNHVTALVLESGMPEVMAVNDYVHGKTSSVDFDAALPSPMTGSLAEIRATMEWLRAWNLGDGRKHPVSVYGADLSGRSGSMLPALDRLEELTSGDAAIKSAIDALRPAATELKSGWWRGAAQKYDPMTPEAKAALTANVAQVVERINGWSASDRDRTESARRLAFLLQKNEENLRLGAFSPAIPRDDAMAQNVLWVASRLGKGERAVYWAHNAHVQRVLVKGPAVPAGSFPGAGSRLAAALGDKYFAIGTSYGGPAVDNKSAATPGSVDATLEQIGSPAFILPLDRTDPWLAEERLMRFQAGYLTVALGSAFDAIVYFDHATAATKSN